MSNQVLERFHRALIEEIQTQRPEYLKGPFTVAEIYQNLVPYGSHRDRIGVEMNGDYEDALLRLLAGEGEYLVLDSEAALQALQSEIQSSNPNTGMYREFAAVDVRLNQAYLDLSADAMDDLPDLEQELEAEDPVAMAALGPSASPAGELGIVPPGTDIFSEGETDGGQETGAGSVEGTSAEARPPVAPESSEAEPASTAEPGQCLWCNESLPDRAPMNFCPFCGKDQNLIPCGSCGSELEPGWRFCASCGSSATP